MATIFSTIDPEDAEAIVALACSLDEKKGKNWVENEGGLPEYICRIAKAIKRSGKSTQQAIAIAVSRVKKWAAGGDGVDAKTKAKAAAAVAQWMKKRASAKADNTVAATNDLFELTYNDMSVLVDDTKFTDAQLALAASFESCKPTPLDQIMSLSRAQKDFVSLSVLTSKKRKKLDTGDFALPEQRKYPIPDESHARNALARVAQHGTPEEKAKVKAAVKRKFPNIDVSGV